MKPSTPNSSMLASVLVTSRAFPIPTPAQAVALLNRGAGDAFAAFGNSNGVVAFVPTAHTVAAPTANYQQQGGALIAANLPATVLTVPTGATHLALIGSANCSVYITPVNAPCWFAMGLHSGTWTLRPCVTKP